MRAKKEKIQITLPLALVEKIEEDIKNNFTSKSLWFERLICNYFSELTDRENNNRKNIIKLDI